MNKEIKRLRYEKPEAEYLQLSTPFWISSHTLSLKWISLRKVKTWIFLIKNSDTNTLRL